GERKTQILLEVPFEPRLFLRRKRSANRDRVFALAVDADRGVRAVGLAAALVNADCVHQSLLDHLDDDDPAAVRLFDLGEFYLLADALSHERVLDEIIKRIRGDARDEADQ